MATFLDVTALQSFTVIFVFLFVVLTVYAILLYTKFVGQNQLIIILIALVLGFFVIISDIATSIIGQIAPVIGVLFVFIAILAVTGRMFGPSSPILESSSLKYIVLVIVIVAVVVGSLAVVRDKIDVPERGEDFSKTSTIIFHPNFLGLILIFLIAAFTVGLLASRQM